MSEKRTTESLDNVYDKKKNPLHPCCSACEKACKCSECLEQLIKDFQEIVNFIKPNITFYFVVIFITKNFIEPSIPFIGC